MSIYHHNENNKTKNIVRTLVEYISLLKNTDTYKTMINRNSLFETYSFFIKITNKAPFNIKMLKEISKNIESDESILMFFILLNDFNKDGIIEYKDFIELCLCSNKQLRSEVSLREIKYLTDNDFNNLNSIFTNLLQSEYESIKFWLKNSSSISNQMSISEIFYLLDQNKKGYIDNLDLYYFISNYNYEFSILDSDLLFHRLDIDKNNKITLSDLEVSFSKDYYYSGYSSYTCIKEDESKDIKNGEILLLKEVEKHVSLLEYFINSLLFLLKIDKIKQSLYLALKEEEITYRDLFLSLSSDRFNINKSHFKQYLDKISLCLNIKEENALFGYFDMSRVNSFTFIEFFMKLKPLNIQKDFDFISSKKSKNICNAVIDLRTILKYYILYYHELEESKVVLLNNKNSLSTSFYFISNMKTYITYKDFETFCDYMKVDLSKTLNESGLTSSDIDLLETAFTDLYTSRLAYSDLLDYLNY